jgi:hypothetical protein
MFSATKHILQTITRDPKTERVRSIKPGEEAQNMWDGLDNSAKAFRWSPDDGETNEVFEVGYTYTEADELEDALLFPLEANGQMADNLFRNDPSAMEIFEKGSIDVRKFANDEDTDDEWMGSDEDEYDDFDSELDDEELAALEDDDGDSEWGTDDDGSEGGRDLITAEEQDAIDETIGMLAAKMKQFVIREPDYFLPILRNPAAAKGIPESVKKDPVNLMHVLRNAFRCLKEYDSSQMGMHADFMRHIDRQKSKGMWIVHVYSMQTIDQETAFKNCWHQADQEPGAIKRYGELMLMIATMDQMIMHDGLDPGPFELAKFMQMVDHFREERRVVDDCFKAYAAISLFFETDKFKAHRVGSMFKDSLLLNQEERAKNVPDRRTHNSNKTMPTDFWKPWDKLLKDNKRCTEDDVDDIYPLEWRKAIRPIVIRRKYPLLPTTHPIPSNTPIQSSAQASSAPPTAAPSQAPSPRPPNPTAPWTSTSTSAPEFPTQSASRI